MTPTRGSHQRTTGRLGAYAASLLLLAPLTACGTGDGEPAAEPPGPARTSATAGPAPSPNGDRTDDPTDAPATGSTDAGEDEAGLDPEAADLPPVRDRVSLPALMREEVRGSGLTTTRQLAETDNWTGYAATYRVDGATVSGELLVPKGEGPFPALVLNHGYIDPDVYVLGQGMSREQEWFAAAGFVVLHTDYRGHAGSDPVSDRDRESRLVYTRDAIGAVKALQRMPYVDADRTAYVGRSMGGGVTLNAIVAEPDLVDAAVVFASVSSSFVDNLRQFTEPNRPDGARAFYARHGTPQDDPRFYDGLSSRTYFDRVEVPVLLHHGTADDTCPPQWSRETDRLLTRAGADSTLVEWPGEGHAFGPRFGDSMRRTVAFLRRHLDA
ncbi:alpha/beta fold hydrolase [Nocardioides sp.]|uniref:alpha/beta hydrolase family protein n=1 Tax=Nocardioides sp. TaxID=35761 RepID=UPI00262309B7|nr:alpha/beta fold hydrolase [Nocardioides sp.]